MQKYQDKSLTQKERILDYLKLGCALTPMEALDMFGCFRLAAIVHELRKEGYNVKSRTIESINFNGKTKHFSEYQL